MCSQILVGLERVTPPKQWSKDDLIADAKNWVGPNKTWASSRGVREWVEGWVEKKFAKWQRTMDMIGRENLSFEEFVQDPTRWATSGGAPRVEWEGDEYRSKWAWAMKNISEGKYLYAQAKSMPNIAHAAIKEEPSKTRLVITTPMSSYLRQSYVMYLFGIPELNSPIYGNKQLGELNNIKWASYCSIDAKAFDHQIPIWFIKLVMEHLFKSVGRDDLWYEERAHINRLKIEVFGEIIPYHGGVLSGWRLTSLLGTLASQALCEWLILQGVNTNFVVQGDDILLYSAEPIPPNVPDMVQEFGLKIDPVASIPRTCGYFLRRAYGGSFNLMSSGRALRSLFYASPWVERSQFQTPNSLARSWLQFMSRVPGKSARPWLLRQAAADMARWARWPGWTKNRWFELLTTDSGLGGLGTVDTHIHRQYLPQIKEDIDRSRHARTAWKRLYEYFVPVSGLMAAKDQQVFYRMSYRPYVRPTPPTSAPKLATDWADGVNKTDMCFNVMQGGFKALPEDVKRSAPHWLRTQPWFRVLDWLLRPEEMTAPQHLCIQPWILNEMLQSDISAADRVLHNMKKGVISKKFSMYQWILARAGKLMVALGSW